MQRMKLQSLVITRGRDGMVAFNHGHKKVDIPIFGSDEVADVTGAGDTVIAAFTAALAAGASTEEAAQLANYAVGIVVMKRGTATVSRQELLHAIEPAPPVTISSCAETSKSGRTKFCTATNCACGWRNGGARASASRSQTAISICCTWAMCATFGRQRRSGASWWSPLILMSRCVR